MSFRCMIEPDILHIPLKRIAFFLRPMLMREGLETRHLVVHLRASDKYASSVPVDTLVTAVELAAPREIMKFCQASAFCYMIKTLIYQL